MYPNFKKIYNLRKKIKMIEIGLIFLTMLASVIGFNYFKSWWVDIVKDKITMEMVTHRNASPIPTINTLMENYINTGNLLYITISLSLCILLILFIMFLENHDFFIKGWDIREIYKEYKREINI